MSKKSTKAPNGSVKGKEEKLSLAPRKSINEIDEIFAGKKRKKPDKDKAKKHDIGARADVGVKKKSKKKVKDCDKNTEIKETGGGYQQRKRVADGLAIYTEEELGIGNRDAGGTPLCPFDCDCCF